MFCHFNSSLAIVLHRAYSRTAEQSDEVAALQSITSSAMLSSDGGTTRPSIRAIWALMINSTLVDRHQSGSLPSSLHLRISNL
jgi:hypothetical protein